MKTVITYGTFDLFHTGHLRLLERAKKLGDRLIVGVTSDFYDQSRGKLNVMQTLAERVENVRRTGLADEIIIEEEEGQKITDIQKYGVDIFTIGSDWVDKFDYLSEYCEVVYLERTKGVSSTELRQKLVPIVHIGMVGCGRIATRFLQESKFVSGLEVTAVCGRDAEKAAVFAKQYSLADSFADYDLMLKKVDAVYIALPHHLHYEYTRKALLAGKHVLCEKPLVLSSQQAKELFTLADSNNLILMEAIKTAYCPGFNQLLGIAKSGTIGTIKAVDAVFTKLITDKSLREYDASQAGGAFTELASYPLMAITRLLGSTPCNVSFIAEIDKNSNVDTFARANLVYSNAIASATVAIGAKREGDLCITGTMGYIYVPAPWWKTEYFEVRYEDSRRNRKYYIKFEEDGLRYEIAHFLRKINGNSNSQRLPSDESVFIADIIEQFRKGENTQLIDLGGVL